MNSSDEAQDQMIQSDKMATLGQLTAGIAHEINNPITSVASNIQPLKRDVNEILRLLEIYSSINENNLAEKLEEVSKYQSEFDVEFTIDEIHSLIMGIEDGARRTAAIVKGLRNFSRADEKEMAHFNLNDAIESTLLLLNNKLKHQNIEVVRALGNLPDVLCFPIQLEQVFMNLLVNAIDAIGENGKIFITTDASSANDFVTISIRDTGEGMSGEVLEKLFDPFFTTKEIGKGTGLGLSISHSIIEKHKGRIEVKSEEGQGTEFIITIPVQGAP